MQHGLIGMHGRKPHYADFKVPSIALFNAGTTYSMAGQGREPDVLFNMYILQRTTPKPFCYPRGSRTCVGVFRLMLGLLSTRQCTVDSTRYGYRSFAPSIRHIRSYPHFLAFFLRHPRCGCKDTR